MAVTGQKLNRIRTPSYMTENGNLGKFRAADHNGIEFAPKQYFYKKVAMGMQSLKM